MLISNIGYSVLVHLKDLSYTLILYSIPRITKTPPVLVIHALDPVCIRIHEYHANMAGENP